MDKENQDSVVSEKMQKGRILGKKDKSRVSHRPKRSSKSKMKTHLLNQ